MFFSEQCHCTHLLGIHHGTGTFLYNFASFTTALHSRETVPILWMGKLKLRLTGLPEVLQLVAHRAQFQTQIRLTPAFMLFLPSQFPRACLPEISSLKRCINPAWSHTSPLCANESLFHFTCCFPFFCTTSLICELPTPLSVLTILINIKLILLPKVEGL